ncbi:hypothetical protein EPUS_08460 [Endocarpon pusillum Z07020]|uniref:Caleosin-domain-containing protein n=1 Tax=Endocarpon pusillum (strain Z07020 / HMAS-L-300199) TaxID=1263415 RepID=U1GYE4_ENDPU|nr:uncharacterized protein EPUS_08460 [Endocarpon pusillum Z07020]ERF77156.1 hypothetical protein EPUS_08460 [Endocarpon pusillum Z07020]
MAPGRILDASPPKLLNRDERDTVDDESEYGFTRTISEVLVTQQRLPFVPDATKTRLEHAGTARANVAASAEHPDGTKEDDWAARHQHQTVLQQHVDFFDPDRDGVIWPLDTLIGLHKLGFNWVLSTIAAIVIHAQFSYPTQPTYLPDPLFRIYSANIHKTKHGSDTDTYDNEGRFIPQKFEDIFAKYAQPGKDTLSFWDLWNALKGQRLHGDPFGWANAFAEWGATYLMLWPEDGEMKKEDLRRVYDGSLFYTIAERRAAKQKNH